MNWSDFLRYSKYIAVFYAAAFVMAFSGIWITGLSEKFIWSGALLGATALAGNLALGFYYNNHKGLMLVAKNDYIAEQGGAQTITGDGKTVALSTGTIGESGMTVEFEEFLKEQTRQALRRERGY